jgi:Zn finger protein HypA/HybF involved in hydrogenase expression
MARERGLKFFECPDCNKVTLLSNAPTEHKCPGCGSANGRVISSTELERRIEEGAVFNIDLSPSGRDKDKRQ